MMVPKGTTLLINFALALVSLAGSLALVYYLYGYLAKKPIQDTHTPHIDEYSYSFYNQKGQKLSKLDGVFKLMIDPFTIYKNYPNQKTRKYSINEFGFRDSYTSDKPFTAIVLGGSAAFGWVLDSDDKAFPSKLSRYNNTYNVINSAVMGFLSGQELSQMVQYLDEFSPSLYIVFDGWNDIYNPYAFAKTWPMSFAPIGYSSNFYLIGDQLANYYNMAGDGYNSEKFQIPPALEFLPNEEVYFQKILKTYIANISKMHAFASSRGAQFIVVFQPEIGNKKVLSKSEQEVLNTWTQKYRYLERKISERYKELIKGAKKEFLDRNIKLIDINDEYEFVENPETLFFDVVHPNELGHEIVARIINTKLAAVAQDHVELRSTVEPPSRKPVVPPPPRCKLTFVTGWHAWEWGPSGHDWWRWTDGHGEIHVVTAERGDVHMDSEIYSIHRPNSVDVLLNGEKVATWAISWDLFKAVEPLTLHLEMGENRIELVSHKPARYIPSDSRPLAFAVRNLRVDGPNSTAACEWQR
jgi:lysophospholipase L1-like esterase